MKISGFTFVRNASKLYFPVRESILSVLPICDEFIVALGDNDPDDETTSWINDIHSSKIKIINTVWDTKKYNRNTEYARQTDIAKEACKGDWLIYIQSDEVIHEKYLPIITSNCERYLNNPQVDGFLFSYKHFWGDYFHFQKSHCWYSKEIRIVRNDKKIHSLRDAQTFRYFHSFNYTTEDYLRKKRTRKLNVIELDAEVYHYGWVRPPELMPVKIRKADESFHGKNASDKRNRARPVIFDYGPMKLLAQFHGTHPKVMKDWIARFNWKEKLNYGDKDDPVRIRHAHEKFKNKILTFIEQNLMSGKHIGCKHWRVVKSDDS